MERNLIRPEILESARGWEKFSAEIVSKSAASLAAACGLRENDLEPVFAFYADLGPTATLVGTGIQRYRYGGENVRFINALALLSGNIGRSGGGTYYHEHSLRHLNNSWAEAPGKPGQALRLPMIGSEILGAADPPIRMIWVNGSNIVNQAADTGATLRAFEKAEFKVVVDAFMTDTAAAADLILPSTLMLEQEDVATSFFHDAVHHVRAVLPAPGEAKSDHWIVSRIGERLSPPVILPDMETCFSRALDSPHLGISFPELRRLTRTRAKQPEIPYAELTFAHSDGKCRLPTRLHEEPPPPSGYPLRLLSLIRRESIHSQILPEEQGETPILSISPEGPEAARFQPGSAAWVVSPLGRLKVRIAFLPGLHPAAAVYRRGDWKRFGGGVNQIIAAAVTDLGKCAAYYDQYVRIEPGEE
jgi:anaerobic selenocysteine-containing dehydrogenase